MTTCRGGDYCDEVCPGPGLCEPAPIRVPSRGNYLVRNGKFIEIHNLYTQVKGAGLATLGFEAVGWVKLDEWVEHHDV